MLNSEMFHHLVTAFCFDTAEHTKIWIVMAAHQVFTTIPCFAKICKDKAIDFMYSLISLTFS
jgi:hypothetical protein